MDEIKKFWKKSSSTILDKDGLYSTARDPYLQEAVENIILKYLNKKADIIDIGCGNGMSSIKFAKKAKFVHGVDYIDNFIFQSQKNSKKIKNISFSEADVTKLPSDLLNKFDVAITIRCLINLPTWNLQKIAIKQISNCLKKGGLFFCSEGWDEGMKNLNLERNKVGLQKIKVVKYNKMIKKKEFENEVKKYFFIKKFESTGFYYLISRLIHPIIKRPKSPKHKDKLNAIASEIQKKTDLNGAVDYLDPSGVYILKKK